MDRVLKMDGEGLMLKDPESKYERRRSEKLLKVKKFDDSEAIVIGH
jgi:DNA ligase-1